MQRMYKLGDKNVNRIEALCFSENLAKEKIWIKFYLVPSGRLINVAPPAPPNTPAATLINFSGKASFLNIPE